MFLLPWLSDRVGKRHAWLVAMASTFIVGTLGVVLVPSGAYAWVVALGIASGGMFALVLTLPLDLLGAVVIDLIAPEASLEPYALTLPQLAQKASGLVTPEELVSRPEIAQARLGQPATAIRRVDVAGGSRVLYAPAPVLSADGNVLQIVYLATPLR